MSGAPGHFEHLMAGLAVADLGRALDWYGRFVGRPPDVVPNDTEVMWQLSGSGWLYVVLDAERAGRGLLTLMVGDLEAELAGLRRVTSPPELRRRPPASSARPCSSTPMATGSSSARI